MRHVLYPIPHTLYPDSSRVSRAEGLEPVFSVDESATVRARRGTPSKECLEGLSRRCDKATAEPERIRQERDRFKTLQGQTIAEVLVAVALGVVLVGAAASLILPSLKGNTQATNVQAGSTLAKGMLDNLRVFSEGNWNNLLALATGSANTYFLQTAKSPFVAVSGTEAVPYDGITAGLVGWWKLDGDVGSTTADSSGNGNTGTWNGTPSGTAGTFYTTGKIGQYAGLFNGANDYVIAGTSTILNSSVFTVTAWVNPTVASPTYDFVYSSARDCCGAYNGINLATSYSGGGHAFLAIWNSAQARVTANAAVVANTWQHIAGTYDGAKMKIYVNGNLDNTFAYVGGVGSPASFPVTLGALGSTPSLGFQGAIDDVRFYNRALSATEITQIYSDSYKRYFYLNDVYRASSGTITTPGSGSYDPSTKQVTVGYSWVGGATQTLSTYLTRNANNVLDQTDWSGGAATSGTVATTTNSQFATSSNVDYSTTTGSFYLAIPGY